MNTWADIAATMAVRMSAQSSVVREMLATKERYNGDTVIVRPDVKGEPVMRPPSPALLADSIDHLAMRAASVRPTIACPALDESSRRSLERARRRRRALYARWHESAVGDVLLRRGFRHWAGYGTCVLIVVPDHVTGNARIELRDPISAYPDWRHPDDVAAPRDVGFIYGRSVAWLRSRYPEAAGVLAKAARESDVWDVVEWLDATDTVIGLLGPRAPSHRGHDGARAFESTGGAGLELRRWPNRAGIVCVAMPHRVTLDRIMGQVASVMGIVETLDNAMTLDWMATEKAIWPDMVVMGREGAEPKLLSGVWKDGRSGQPNLVADADVKLLQSAPGPLTGPMTARLESIIRAHTGLVPQAGGEVNSGLRTGSAIQSLGAFAVDPRIQEAHETMQRALVIVNESICATELGWWPESKYTVFSGWSADPGMVTYTPSADFDTALNTVDYPLPGADSSEMSVGISQLVGTNLMSKATARRKHPWIDDGTGEERALATEAVEEAVLMAIATEAANGALPLIDALALLKGLQEGKTVVEAGIAAQEAAQARQTTPVAATDPATAPGLAMPGMGVEAPPAAPVEAPPPIPGVDPGLGNFRELANALRAKPQ